MARHLFTDGGADYALLNPLTRGNIADYLLNSRICAAVNDWLLDRWLEPDTTDRFRGTIRVNPEDVAGAVAEIERLAGHPKMVQVGVPMQSREPYGKPMFEPIWEAAAGHGLPVAVHINGGNGVDHAPTFAGHAYTYPGYAAFMPLNSFVHLATLIIDGMFGRHPDLRFVFADGGYDILTPLMWRLDTFWMSMRDQTPWVDRYPSEYLRRSRAVLHLGARRADRREPGRAVAGLHRQGGPAHVRIELPTLVDLEPGRRGRGPQRRAAGKSAVAQRLRPLRGGSRSGRKSVMTTVERVQEDREEGAARDIAVTIVDTDVHPLPVSGEVLKSYAPAEWKDKLWPTGNAVSPVPHFYDTPDSYKTMSLRVDANPPGPGAAGSDPDFAAKQLLIDAGVSIALLEPMCDAQLPQAEHVLKATYNDWLADVWLGENNWHGRWRGAISVTAQDPAAAAREIERWAGHPYMAEVLMTPQTRGIPFGSPHFDPLYEAAARNSLPVATHLMGQTPFELIPIYPVGNPAHWHDFFASWPLLYVSHLMSLVFDGAFDRHPELRVVFVEGGFTWAMPVMSRMDRIWEQRKADLPQVRRKPSDYVRDHVRFTTQPLEDVNVAVYREYIAMMDLGDNIMFSTDYPHWSYDAPDWAIRRFPADQRERIMRGNATALYGLPSTVKALPGEQPAGDRLTDVGPDPGRNTTSCGRAWILLGWPIFGSATARSRSMSVTNTLRR